MRLRIAYVSIFVPPLPRRNAGVDALRPKLAKTTGRRASQLHFPAERGSESFVVYIRKQPA